MKPKALGLRVGNGSTTGSRDPAPSNVGKFTADDENRGHGERRATNALTTMDGDVLPRSEGGGEASGDGKRVRHFGKLSVRNRGGDELEAVGGSESRFHTEIELGGFRRLQRRDEHRVARGAEAADFIFKPIATSGSKRHGDSTINQPGYGK